MSATTASIPTPQPICPTDGDHEIDFGAGSVEVDGERGYFNVPCSRCGAWALFAVPCQSLNWGEPDDGVSMAPVPGGSSSAPN
jgi:hypothetical protein